MSCQTRSASPKVGIHGHTQWAYRREVKGHLVRTTCDASGSPRHWLVSDEDEIPLVIAAVKSAAREFFEVLPEMLPEANRPQGE